MIMCDAQIKFGIKDRGRSSYFYESCRRVCYRVSSLSALGVIFHAH